MGHVHLELVVGTRVQVTYVEGRTRGGDVGEQCSVLEIHLLERIVWYPYTARKLLEKKKCCDLMLGGLVYACISRRFQLSINIF